ncbi:Photosystem I P700 chlorophyll a apoprotein A1 [Platanthera zijinensis]|uniref:Photosystem I P700 chlorophyll a apoprotein A1 n=1 Tax=Platanthera zijinensis TaxID=2320716 RepID=A0AAP0BAM6_9ASPA
MLGSLTIVVAHHMYSMPPYPYLAIDYGTQLSLFTHHMWIGGFLIVGAAAHAAIFMVRDYDPIISHLNWACIFLGFHSFGLYIHNDTMSALGRPQDMFSDTAIQLQPIFAQWVQNTHALAPSVTAPGTTTSTSLTWGGGELIAVGGKSGWTRACQLPYSDPCTGFGSRWVPCSRGHGRVSRMTRACQVRHGRVDPRVVQSVPNRVCRLRVHGL